MRMKEIIRPIKAHQGEEIPERLGMLTPTESSELIDTYRKGATGSVVIGTRCGSRVITILVPAASSREAAISQIQHVVSQLQRLRCSGYIYVRRMHLSTNSRRKIEAIVIDDASDYRCQRIDVLSDRQIYRISDWNNRITDELNTALAAAFDSGEPS